MDIAIAWNDEKNKLLIKKYGFGFERIVFALSESDALLDDRQHPNTQHYGHQRQLVVRIEGYAYIVPYVQTNNELFLKTFFPSRNATKHYIP